jgi:hypothetical protein
LLGGGPGDVMAGSKISSVNYLDPGKTDKCVRDFCTRLASGAEYLGLLFRKKIVKEYLRDVYRSLLESFSEITGPTAAHRITTWELLNRWPAFTFTSVMHNHPDVSEAFCHLGYKYSDLLLKLRTLPITMGEVPLELRYDRREGRNPMVFRKKA